MQQAMQAAATRAFTQMLFLDGIQHNVANQFIELNVSRENLVADTIRELSPYTHNDYKKPLKVSSLICLKQFQVKYYFCV